MKKYIISERPNLFEPNVYISMVIRLNGDISADKVSASVKAAYCANEATMSRIVLQDDGTAYYQKIEKSGCKISVINTDWRTVIRTSEKKPFDINDGELIRTFILPQSDGITLVIHAHHLVGDGKSILILVRDILDYLSGKTLEYKPMLILDEAYLSKYARMSLGIRLLIKKVNHKWAKTGKVFLWDDYYRLHEKYWKSHVSDFEITYYSVAEKKKYCKGGTTLNSLLITEMLRDNPQACATGIPVSIRNGNMSMSNQTSGIAIKFHYNKTRSFDQNLTKVHRKIYARLKNANSRYFVLLFISALSPTIWDGVLMQTHGCFENPLSAKMADSMSYTGNNCRDLGVTNLGVIDIPTDLHGFTVSDILFIPPKVSYSKDITGVSSLGDKLTVCRHIMNDK